MTDFTFQAPTALMYCSLAVAVLLLWCGAVLRRHGVPRYRMVVILLLRLAFFVALVVLIARPVWTASEPENTARNHIALLLDRSESMSVMEDGTTRYQQAVEFVRTTLLPLIDQSQLQVRPYLFANGTQEVDGDSIAAAVPDGQATNLGLAIVQSIVASDPPPLAVVALTDGILTNARDHNRAISVAVNRKVPLIGIGFGSESGGRVVGLDEIVAPSIAEPDQKIRISVRLQATGEAVPALELMLLRDGQMVDRRRLDSFDGPRIWSETFEVTAAPDGVHTYDVHIMPPSDKSVVISNSQLTTTVRSLSSREIRVLYVQGGLTWDYKFVHIAMNGDPTIRLTGLSRTANSSRFFENVQSDADLINGFPNTLDKLSEFRVVVLSNLRPGDLTDNQQQLLAKYCGHLGGGVLMIGGQQTFNASWRDSRLEELLPVQFAVAGNRASDQNFSVEVTEQALKHPVFQISDEISTGEAWNNLPLFSNRAMVDNVKPGAVVWLKSRGDAGNPVLMASQRYGNGVASVICMQNFWRWRLARSSEPRHFDRFWRQLFRHLADAGRDAVTLNVANSDPAPGDEIELLIEQPEVAGDEEQLKQARLVVTGPDQIELVDRVLDLQPGQLTATRFQADTSGMYTASLLGDGGTVLTSRDIQVRNIAAELVSTARSMDLLRQFAALSGGMALEVEKSDQEMDALREFLKRDEQPESDTNVLPAGINGWVLAILLGCLSVDWLCRKRWKML